MTGIAPNAGPTNGGTAVSIAGTNFLTGATVNFGSLPAGSVTVNSLTNIIAITSAQGVEEVNVVLTNGDGQVAVLTNGFIYQAEPTITWAAPAAMTYGAALSAQQLNASAGVPGVFAYSPTAGTVLNAGTSTLTVVFTPQDTVDYSIASNNVSLEVVPAPLAVTANNVSRQYGQSNPALTGSITGLQNGDNITATYSCTASASSTVGTYSIVPTLVDPNNRLGNYSVTLNDGTLTVTTAPLSVTANNVTRKYGQSNPALTGSITGLQNGDNITATYSCTATASSTVGTYSIVPTLVDPNNRLGNYSVTLNDGTLTVTTAPLAVTANNVSRQYGQSNPALTGSITGLQNGDNITATYSCTATASSTVGAYSIVPSLSDPANRLGNYSLTVNNGTLTIIQAAPVGLTGIAPNAGPTNGGTAVSIAGTNFLTGATVNFGSLPAASVTVNSLTNIIATTPAQGVGEVNVVLTNGDGQVAVLTNGFVYQAEPTITWAAPAAMTYGTALSAQQLNASAGVPGVFAYSPTAGTVLNAGTSTLTVVFTPQDTVDYSIASNNVSVEILPAPLAVTANNVSRQYGQSNPALTGSITGLQNGDNITATYSCTATASSTVGAYSIVPSLSDPANRLGNYSVTLNDGTLTVTTAPLAVTANNVSRQYGQSNPALTGSITGLQNGDNITATYSCTATASSSVGAYSIVPSLSDPANRLGNYSLTVNNGTLTIIQAAPVGLTGIAPNAGPTNGGTAVSIAGTNFLTGATVNFGSLPAGSVTVNSLTNIIAITPAQGVGEVNVVLTNGDGQVAVLTNGFIYQAEPTITWAAPAAMTYGAALSAQQLNASAGVPGVFAYSPTAGTVLNAGTSTLTVVSTPQDTVDYSIASNNVSVEILPASLAVTANNVSRQYGQSNPALTGSITGLQNGDNITATYSCTATASSTVGAYSIVPTLVDPNNRLGNYSVTLNDGTLTVTTAPLAVTANNVSRQYGQSNPALTGSITGLQNGDNITATYSCTATASSTVGTYSIVPSLSDPANRLGNYSLTVNNGTLTIIQAAPVGLTGIAPNAGPTNGGTAVSIAGTNFLTGATVNFGSLPAASVTVNSLTNIIAITPAQGVGEVNVVLTNGDGQVAVLTNGFIYQAEPTITWAAPAAMTYGTALSAQQLNASASVPGVFAYSPTAGTVLNAGTTTLTVVFTPQDTVDYSIASNNVSLEVVPAPLAVTANNVSRQYGQSNPALTGSITGLQNGDNITATYSCTATASSSVGTYSIVPTLVDPNNRLGNYSVTLNDGSLTVTTVPLGVTANSATRQYGQSNPTLTGSITGLQNGDNITATYSCTATASSTVGTYSIVPSLSDPANRLGNYSLTVNNGTLTIIQAAPVGLTGIAPNAGPTNGGTAVSIAGTNFLTGATVNFGSLPAGSVTVNSLTNITAITPAQGVGEVNVVLTNGDGQVAVLTNGFIYQAEPTITWAAPAAMTYGAALSAQQLNASAGVPGVFAYSPTAGTVLNAGTTTLTVVFTPQDTVDYSIASNNVSVGDIAAPWPSRPTTSHGNMARAIRP